MIAVFGSINVDLIFAIDSLPRPGETVLCPSYVAAPGGKGLNQAVAAARAGAVVQMAGCVGRDEFASTALASLKNAGVDDALVRRVDSPTGCAAVCVDADGENQIAVASGANLDLKADQVPDSLLGQAITLVMQMEVAPEENWALVKRARAAGARILLNLAPAKPVPEDALERIDFVVLNAIEAVTLAQALKVYGDDARVAARRISERHAVTTIVSLGSDGAAAFSPRGEGLAVDALEITPIDTVGAGDAFVGALAAALDGGDGLAPALHKASIAGGLACLKMGAAPSLPAKDEIEGRLSDLAPPRSI